MTLLKAFCQNSPTFSGSATAATSSRISAVVPGVAAGVSELRVKGEDGSFRAFYYSASAQGILVFQAFDKKTQRALPLEIEVARKRVKELLDA